MADKTKKAEDGGIPVGLSTRVGQIVSAIFGLIALITAVLHGDHTPETITSLVMAGLTLFVMMGGRYAQAVVKLLKSDPNPQVDVVSAPMHPPFDNSEVADGDSADWDGPGDAFDLLPHIAVSDPSAIKPDHKDHTEEKGKLLATLASAKHPAQSRLYRLSDHERGVMKSIMLKGIEDLLRNAAAVHYTQDYRLRWEAIAKPQLIVNNDFLRHGDCSSTTTWLLFNGLHHLHYHADVVNRQEWKAGYTGTQINHGRTVRHDENLRFGDLIFYGDQGGGVPEHVAMYIGGGMVFSHGGEGGPYKLPLDYRPDRRKGEAKRYF